MGLWRRITSRMQPVVFFGAAALVVALTIYGGFFTDTARRHFEWTQRFLVDRFAWFYILCVTGLLAFVAILPFTRYGDRKLGKDDDEPEFTLLGWFSMLFSAGMGIGLVFWGVAEPMIHWDNPPLGVEPRSPEAIRMAMRATFYHWGLHPWAIYIVLGLGIALMHFRHDLPLAPRSLLYPLLGRRVEGVIGHVVDILCTVGTLVGVAASLGLGSMQINAGLKRLVELGLSRPVQIGIIAVITIVATISVVSGIHRGIRRLSQANLVLMGGLLLFVLVAGPTWYLLNFFATSLGTYLQHLPFMSLWVQTGEHQWQQRWTLGYWGWWLAWAPFVGVFVARISRGRTVREFVLGVLLAPTLASFVWIAVIGGAGLHIERFGGGGISEVVTGSGSQGPPQAMHAMLEHLPWPLVTGLVATILTTIFFITSSDSGSLVDDMVTSGGHPNPPKPQRVFWAVSEGVVAAVLVLTDGVDALRTSATAIGLLMAILVIGTCFATWRTLKTDDPRPKVPT